MATLEKIRSKAAFLVIIIGVALLAFIIGDFLNSGQSFFMMSKNKVATVNGTSIGVEEYQQRVQARSEEMQAMYQQRGIPMPDGASAYINKEVYDAMVNEILLGEELEAVGITVSKEELNDLLTGDNIVPQVAQSFTNPETGQFDRQALNNFLQVIFHPEENGYTQPEQLAQIAVQRNIWLEMEKSVRQSRAAEKLAFLVDAAVVPNKVDAEMAFAGQNNSVDIAYVMQPYTSIPDSTIEVTKGDLTAEYNKVKKLYENPERRSISYIAVDIKPAAADYEKAEERINMLKELFATTDDVAEVVNDNSDYPYADYFVAVRSMDADEKNFVENAQVGEACAPIFANDTYSMYRLMDTKTAPDSIQVRMVNFPIGDTRVDSVYNLLRNGGDFAALGDDLMTVENVWLTESMIGEVGRGFINDVFSAGDGFFKTESIGGSHIVQVTERTAPVKKAKVAVISISVDPSNDTYNALHNGLLSYVAANDDAKAFADSAQVAGYSVMNADCSAEDIAIPGIQDGRQIVRWAFNAKKDEISEIFTIGDRFVVAALEEVLPAGYVPMKDLETMLTMRVRNDKKAAIIAEQLAAVTPAEMSAYAAAVKAEKVDTAKFVTFSSPSISGLGYEPAVAGVAPSVEKGKISAPVKGNRGVYVLQVVNVNESAKPYDEAAEIARLDRQYTSVVNSRLMQVLRDKADIENTLIRFF